tara:strand:- start:36 stop:416 length:381 start_codon:yes stop_codon:yes gene_type:complete
MTDHLARAHRIQMLTLDRVQGEWVEYSDGDVLLRIRAVRAGADRRNASGDGDYVIHANDMDWLILAERLQIDGVQIEPRPGATITPEKSEGVYEVTNGASGNCFEWSDTRQVRLRIHTDKTLNVDA